jgi:hypothetical protein
MPKLSWMLRGQRADAHQRRHHRYAAPLGKGPELPARARCENAAARADDGLRGRGHRGDKALYLQGVPPQARFVAADIHGLGVGEIDMRLLHIDRQVYEHRAGAPAGGYVESFAQHARQRSRILDKVAVLAERLGRARDIGLLEDVAADKVAAHLAGKGDERDGIHIRRGERGDEIGGAGPRCGEADARPAGDAREAVRRVAGALLVAHEHEIDLRAAQLVQKRAHSCAGVAEDSAYSLRLERAYHSPCSSDHIAHPPYTRPRASWPHSYTISLYHQPRDLKSQ